VGGASIDKQQRLTYRLAAIHDPSQTKPRAQSMRTSSGACSFLATAAATGTPPRGRASTRGLGSCSGAASRRAASSLPNRPPASSRSVKYIELGGRACGLRRAVVAWRASGCARGDEGASPAADTWMHECVLLRAAARMLCGLYVAGIVSALNRGAEEGWKRFEVLVWVFRFSVTLIWCV